jgi:predicted CxxxxCH...CXXCH cytochrome family protein
MRRLTLLSLLLAAAALGGCRKAKTPTTTTKQSVQSCTGCHGTTGNAAPPRATTGATATSDISVGAHAAHLAPGPFRKAVGCDECHPVPKVATDPGHDDGQVQVVFAPSPVATITARWNRGSATCSGIYCHGATLAGGTITAPVWTRVDGSQVACGTCHGIPPPPESGHPKVDSSIPGYTSTPTARTPSTLAVCATCHPDTVTKEGAIDVQRGAHIDRVLQIGAYACARCHGDAGDTTRDLAVRPAPPNGNGGETATTARAVGAHTVHLTKAELTETPIACGECHAVPTSMLHHPKGRVDLSWGPLATAGGSAPSWNAGTLTCSSTYCHGSTLSGGTATAPKWTQVDGSQRKCTSCHGMPPSTPAHAQDAQTNPTPSDCNACHAGYSSTAVVKATHIDGLVNVNTGGAAGTCTTCHGDATRSPAFLRPAPPRALGNGGNDPSDHGVGAHLAHLTGNRLSATPVACAECHPPQVRTNHAAANGYGLHLQWGPLATKANAHPSYDAQAFTCSSTYCHGSSLSGGTIAAPKWTTVTNDPSAPASQVACGACHGIPPPAPHVTNTDCGTCHTGYTATLVNLALHINGEVDISGGTCTTCHGDASRTPSSIAAAPPAEARLTSGTAPWAGDGASGAHLKHLVAGPLAKAIACTECHAKVAAAPAGGTDPHGDGKATLTFGALATADGARPTFDAATVTCSNTYCHGATRAGGTNTKPVWTRTDGSQVACGTCHAVPPADATHDGLASGASCGGCHDGYGGTKGGAAGSFTVNTAIHVDGTVNASGGTCTTCHGTKGRTLVAGADAQAEAAPPVDAKGFTAAGAHLAHVNKAALTTPVGCSECHPAVGSAPKGGADTHGDGKATVVPGNRSKGDGAAATFDAASGKCASNYCHGATLTGGSNTAPVWTKVDGTQAACGTCHGIPPPSPHSANTSCGTCHTGYTATTVNVKLHIDGKVDSSGGSCTSCHGDAARTPSSIAAAPPAEAKVSSGTAPWAGDGANGAHLAHLKAGSLGPATACGECHTVPAAAPRGGTDTHGDGKATLVFGTLARTGGATPTFNASTASCSGVYCHGAKMSGGTATTPVWTRNDGTQAACGACHGVPPADSTHNGLASGAACKSCHTGYGGTKGGTAFTVNTALHLNGVTDATGGTCTSCHGTEGRTLSSGADSQTASAPPANAAGFSTAGAHLAHLNKASGLIGKRLACAECHSVPASSPKGGADPHGDGKATVVFGSLSRTGGKSPSFNASNLTCSSTYCHGTASVRWDAGAQSCTACHALPPQDACHTGWTHEASGGRCNGCHRNTNSSGTSINNAAQHVDGVIQGQCNDCHRGGGLSCTNHGGGD